MKFKLLESVLTSTGDHFIYLNPTTKELRSREDTKWNRGVIDPEGNLYMEAKWLKDEEEYEESLGDYLYSDWTHQDLIEELHNAKKFQKLNLGWWGEPESLDAGIVVQRYQDTLDIFLAESYDIPLNTEIIRKVFKLCKKKNPYLEFYIKKLNSKGWDGLGGDGLRSHPAQPAGYDVFAAAVQGHKETK